MVFLLNKTIKEYDASFSANKLFFNHAMTVSNHRPFTFPKGKISRFNPNDKQRDGAIAYCDWAIGNFIHQAKQKPWFNNTIFVIVADHCASAAGKISIPVTGYHIPAFVYAPNIVKPQNMERLCSQIDLLPTVLGLMNLSYDSKFLGYDMFQLESGRERAFISTYQKMGFIKNNKMVVLSPKKKIEVFTPNFKDGTAIKIEDDSSLIKEAINWYQGASLLFKSGAYKY